MSKPHTFGALRMTLASMSYDKAAFRGYIEREGFTEAEQEEIRQAFLSINKPDEVSGSRVFGEGR